jgi:hypothetical protein
MSRKYTPHFADPRGALIEKVGVGITLAALAAAPTASAPGYAKGCIFQDTTNGNVYKNTGTATSATWTAMLTGAQGAALTAQLTTIVPADAAGTPDYAIAAVTNSSPFGFSNAAEAITLLYVVANLQVRVAQLEARLQAAGVIA